MENKVNLTCCNCGKQFERRAAEHNRNLRKGRRVMCGRKCQGQVLLDNIPQNRRSVFVPKRELDEYSMFRPFLKNIKKRIRDDEKRFANSDIDLQFLKELWDNQNGICPHTKWKLEYLHWTGDRKEITPNRASLDRIDSSKGYIKGNVQFVAWIYQVAKNTFTDQQVLEFCRAVAN